MELKTGSSVSGGGGDDVKGGGKAIVSLKIFAPAIIFTVVMFGTLVWYVSDSYRYFRCVETRHLRITELIGEIAHFDEVLTMSARMSAATGDAQWQRRYEEYEPRLDAAIKEATSLAPDASMSRAAAQTDAANVRLAQMDREAFELVREGNRQAAMTILRNAEYAEQKRIYREGMKAFTEALQTHAHAELRRNRRQIMIEALSVAVGASLVSLLWVVMLQRLKYGSARRRAEKVLRRSEAQFKSIFEHMPVGFYRTTPGGRILMANPALVRMLGYSSFEELVQRNLEKEGYEPQYSRSEFKERIEKEGRVVGLESAWVKRDGTTLFIIENSRAIRDEDGNTLYYEGTAEDITERKKTEDTILAERNKLKSVAEAIQSGLTIQDLEYNLTYQNDFMTRIFGEHLGEKCYRVIHGIEQVCDGCPVALSLKDGESHTSIRKVVLPSGEITYWENTTSPIRDADGNMISCLKVVNNITDRKRAREALEASEEKFRIITEQSFDVVMMADMDGTLTYASPSALRVFGYRQDEMIGMKVAELVCESDMPKVIQEFKDIAAGKSVEGREVRILRKDGSIGVIELHSGPVLRDGEVVGAQASARDITERKEAEEETRKFKTIAERAGYGNAMIDLEGNLIYVNESFAEMHGYGVGELTGKAVSIFHTKEQMERVNRLLDQLVR
ncbi:MAG: PAS domain S-box protein [Phycisphaerae bacterium]|nr:PAS domain S-box protein [Phycisphaerae bacterium]